MRIVFNDNKGPCPCGSGKDIPDCCLRGNGSLLPEPARTIVKAPVTGFSHERCYASDLCDCSTKITAEHYFSHVVAKRLNQNKRLVVGGMSYLKDGEERVVSPASAASNILCDRHNRALSELDTVGGNFFNALMLLDRAEMIPTKKAMLFNGHDIERWFLKMLCGYLASNETIMDGEIRRWRAPISWLDVLYGKKDFADDFGLYYNQQIGIVTKHRAGLAIAPITDMSGCQVGGAAIEINSFKFLISLTPKHLISNEILADYVYRPCGIYTSMNGSQVYTMMGWDMQTDDGIWRLQLPDSVY